MKKTLAMILAILMALSMSAAFAAEPNEPITSEEDFEEVLDEIEYEPNADYDKYTVVYYYLEDISADMYTMISAKEDDSEFYLEVFWYGVDDMAKVAYDGEAFELLEDQSGFMNLVYEGMINIALEQDMWKPIGEEEA